MKIFILVICSESTLLVPLETLNTNLNYKILDDFISKMTDSTSKLLSNNDNSCPVVSPFPDGLFLLLLLNIFILSFSINQSF
jgi:hypothetical protein